MAEDAVPERVRDFVLRNIDSVAQLEALLLLRREPNTGWDPRALADRLYISVQQALEVLIALKDRHLVTVSDGLYRYECSVGVREIIDNLATIYSRQLIQVTNLVHSKPSGVQAFAEAFKLRKDT
jgi:hypothetical protein